MVINGKVKNTNGRSDVGLLALGIPVNVHFTVLQMTRQAQNRNWEVLRSLRWCIITPRATGVSTFSGYTPCCIDPLRFCWGCQLSRGHISAKSAIHDSSRAHRSFSLSQSLWQTLPRMLLSESTLKANFGNLLLHVSAHIPLSIARSELSRLHFLVVLCFTALIVSLLLFRGFVRRPGSYGTPPELSALQRILVPTSSRWGLSSRQLVARSRVSSHRTIWLSLDALIHCIVCGDVELRHPQRDLPDLLRSSVLVDGLDVRLYVHLLHRIRAILWTTLTRFFDVSHGRSRCGNC